MEDHSLNTGAKERRRPAAVLQGGGGSGACSTPGPPEGVRGSACSGHRCAGSGRPHPTRTGHPEPRRSPGKQVQSTHEHERRLRPEDARWRPRRAHECTSPCHGSPLRLLLPRPAGTATPKPPPRVLTSPLLPGGAALAAGDSEGWCVAGSRDLALRSEPPRRGGSPHSGSAPLPEQVQGAALGPRTAESWIPQNRTARAAPRLRDAHPQAEHRRPLRLCLPLASTRPS